MKFEQKRENLNMKESKIAIVLILALSLTGLFNISLSVSQVASTSGVNNNIDDNHDEKTTDDISSSYYGFNQMTFLISTEDGDNVIEVGEEIIWTLIIIIKNTFDVNMENLVLTDILPPQVSVCDILYCRGDKPVDEKKGKKETGSTHLTWEIGILEPQELAILDLTLCLNTKPAEEEQDSSPVHYKLSSGAKLKFTIQETGLKYNVHAEKVEFDVPSVMPVMSTLLLSEKDSNWEIVDDGAKGKLIFNPISPNFDFTFYGCGLKRTEDFHLIYYADYPDAFINWGGDNPGKLIETFSPDSEGNIYRKGSIDLNMDLPHPNDANYPAGAKIWLVPCSDYDDEHRKLIAWNPTDYLFENNLISYDDTDVAYLLLYKKDSNWDIVEDGAWGNLKYNLAGPQFDYEFYAFGLKKIEDFSLIYYADP